MASPFNVPDEFVQGFIKAGHSRQQEVSGDRTRARMLRQGSRKVSTMAYDNIFTAEHDLDSRRT